MKNKILNILLCVICILCLTGCNSNFTNKEITNQKEKKVSKTWKEDSKNKGVLYSTYFFTNPTGNINHNFDSYLAYMEILLKSYKDENNLFYKKLKEEYQKINLEELSTIEKDSFNANAILCLSDYNLTYNNTSIKNVWKVGYNGNDPIDPLARKISYFILNLDTTNSKRNQMITYLQISKNNSSSKESTIEWFIDKRTDKNVSTYIEGFTGGSSGQCKMNYPNYTNYELYDTNEFTSMTERYKDFFNLLNEFAVNIYLPKESSIHDELFTSINNERTEPKIGMTEEQLLNSKWGKPEKKNTTETVYGKHEQWVYSNGNYVYLDNGIVTAIQK